MIKIVADTNVLISALVFGGVPLIVLKMAHDKKIKLIISAETLIELDRTISAKFPVFLSELEGLRRYIDKYGLIMRSTVTQEFKQLRDPDDGHILQAAAISKATYIITGDKDLLSLQKIHNTHILTPRQFIDCITKTVF